MERIKGLINSIKSLKRRDKILATGVPCVAAAAVLAILLSGSGTGEAFVSLPYIEELSDDIRGGREFTILEIVANADDASFGFYVEGQEPRGLGNWRQELAEETDDAVRATMMSGWKTILEAANVLEEEDTGLMPITWIGDYRDYKPWDTDVPGEAERVDFNAPIYEDVKGYIADGPGPYTAKDFKYEPVADEAGNYRLKIEKLISSNQSTHYYSNPVFSGDTDNMVELFDEDEEPAGSVPGNYLQLNADIMRFYYTGSDSEPIFVDNDTPVYEYSGGVYVYLGTLGYMASSAGGGYVPVPEDGATDAASYWYVVEDYGQLVTTYSDGYYSVNPEQHSDNPEDYELMTAAGVNPYPKGARFTGAVESLTYVGYGYEGDEGTYNFTPDDDGTEIKIYYDYVYYAGGFRNNNWFARYVLDRDSNLGEYARNITVEVATGGSVTAEQIRAADLIVVHANASIGARNVDIYNAATANGGYTPVMILFNGDSVDYGDNTDMKNLVESLAGKPTDAEPISSLPIAGASTLESENGVNDNVFWTVRHINLLRSTYSLNDPAFADVAELIDYHNFLREMQGVSSSDWLPTIISNATAIRHIINFEAQGEQARWSSINVLEIQGGLRYDVDRDPQNGPINSSDLTEEKLREWIGDDEVEINITRMTTYEFVGKIEDLNEKYHLIYIGGSARGLNPAGGESTYNDTTMNGLIYTNIGDRYQLQERWGDEAQGMALQGLVAGDGDWRFRMPGNDLTRAKMNDLRDFASAGYPIIVDERLTIDTDGKFDVSASLRLDTRGNGGQAVHTFTFNAVAPPGVNPAWVTYRWRSPNYENGNFVPVTGQSFTLNPATNNDNANVEYEFYCDITIRGQSASFGPFQLGRSGWRYYILNENGVQVPMSGTGQNTYAEITRTQQIDVGPISDVDDGRVDDSSYMYETLGSILEMRNVISTRKAPEYSKLINRFLNLSKPEIDMKYKPTEYQMHPDGTMTTNADGRTFTYRFNINNPVDATPSMTTYDVELFFDLNGDGRYDTDGEKQTDIVVRDGNGNVLTMRNGRYEIYAGRDYTVTKNMPQEAVGLYQWSLKVTKNDPRGADIRNVRASETGYTRIAPRANEKTEIYILQIASDPPRFGYQGQQQRVNFEWQQRELTSNTQRERTIGDAVTTDEPYGDEARYRETERIDPDMVSTSSLKAANTYLRAKDGTYYEGVYGKLLADVDDFKIKIYTVYAGEVNSAGTLQDAINGRSQGTETELGEYLSNLEEIRNKPNLATELADGSYRLETSSLDEIFMSFDMLIIGFDDSYGTLNAEAANAIAYFIEAGNATLFSHDTVTMYSNPDTSVPGSYGVAASGILRNVTNLDRYGIKNPAFEPTLRGGAIADPPQAFINSLLDNEYSIAWRPKSGKGATVRDVHGYTSYLLWWFRQGGNDGPNKRFMNLPDGRWLGNTISHVTQLNEGKITVYPYYLNEANVDGMPPSLFNNGRLYVGETHGQWYTVNMNKDDIAVWYCLAPGDYLYNDAAGAYYIYNTGNVTYTGAGHMMNQGVTTGRDTSRGSTHPSGSGTNTYGTPGSDSAWPWAWLMTKGIENEAKLFVNTMIAAYRAANELPVVNVTDDAGNPVSYHLMPADETLLIDPALLTADSSDYIAVYFNIEDGNLHGGKRISLSLSYDIGDSALTAFPYREPLGQRGNNNRLTYNAGTGGYPVYIQNDSADTGPNVNGNLQDGVSYWFKMPYEVLQALSASDANSAVTLRLQVTTDIPGIQPLRGYADLVIRRIELFPLS